jgi:hypothetical protein
MIFKSIIQPHIDYCSSIIFMANEGDFHRLQLIQNRALRITLKKPRLTRVTWMLNTLNLQSIKQRVFANTLILIFKVQHRMVPAYMNEEIQYSITETLLQEHYEMRTILDYHGTKNPIHRTQCGMKV